MKFEANAPHPSFPTRVIHMLCRHGAGGAAIALLGCFFIGVYDHDRAIRSLSLFISERHQQTSREAAPAGRRGRQPMGPSNKTNRSAAKRRQQPKRTPSHDQLRGGNHQHSSSPRNRIRSQISIRDRTPWLTVLSPLRGYRGLTLRRPWADAHGYLLSPHSRLLDNDVKRLAEQIGDRRVLALLQGYLCRTAYDGGSK